eukprot:1159398-Pelagomonas_calceolata.AAC.27
MRCAHAQGSHQALGPPERAQLLSGMERVADFLTARIMPAANARRCVCVISAAWRRDFNVHG